MVVFSVFSSRKKRISSEFSPIERSLFFEGLLSPLGRCLSFGRLLSFRLFSFCRIGISGVPFEIFLFFDKDISPVLMLLAIVFA